MWGSVASSAPALLSGAGYKTWAVPISFAVLAIAAGE